MKRLRAVLWIAVSSKAQAEDEKTSLPTQEAAARALCEREGWQVVDVLIVPGHSRSFIDFHKMAAAARANGIDAFDRLEAHWEAADFDVLICRDTERFARKRGSHALIIENVIETAGARIYSMTDGWIDETNYQMLISMGGYKAATDIQRVVKNRRPTLHKLAQRGLPANGTVMYIHKIVRADSGRAEKVILNPDMRRLLDDAAVLLLEGVSYRYIEHELYERFGHVDPRTGRAYPVLMVYTWMRTPAFWGHKALNYRSATTSNGQRADTWVFDENMPAPDGVTIYRNTHEAAYTGELAERVKAELRRRQMTIRGTARPHSTHRFSGLLLCDSCGYGLVYSSKPGVKSVTYRCRSQEKFFPRAGCEKSKSINEATLQAWVDLRLRKMRLSGGPDALIGDDFETEHRDHRTRFDALRREVNLLEEQARRLIEKQITAAETLQAIYDQELEKLGQRLENAQKALAQAQLQVGDDERQARIGAYEAYSKMQPDEFWKMSDTEINQFLHRLMGRWRWVVRNREVIGAIECPPTNAGRRKRT